MNFDFAKYTQAQEYQAGRAKIVIKPRHSTSHDLIPERYHSQYQLFQLNEFEKIAIDFVQKNPAGLIKAPTASGKTFIQDYIVLNSSNSSLVILPTKALLAERASKECGPFDIIHSDSSLTIEQVKSKVLFATAEKGMELLTLLPDTQFISSLKTVIIDELHFIYQKEFIYNTIVQICKLKNISVYGFSATINPELESILQLPLLEHQGNGTSIDYEFKSLSYKNILDHAKVHPNIAVREIQKLIPKLAAFLLEEEEYKSHEKILIFCPTKRICEMVCEELLGQGEKQKITIKNCSLENEDLQRLVGFKIAFHHANLAQHDRQQIERLFSSGEINVIACTSTLAVGINIAPDLVIVFTTLVIAEEPRRLTLDEIIQISGRTGRYGRGKCVILDDCNIMALEKQLCKSLYFSQAENACFTEDKMDFLLNQLYFYYFKLEIDTADKMLALLLQTPYFRDSKIDDLFVLVEHMEAESQLIQILEGKIIVSSLVENLYRYHVSYARFIQMQNSDEAAYLLGFAVRELRCFLSFAHDYCSAELIAKTIAEKQNGISTTELIIEFDEKIAVKEFNREQHYLAVVETDRTLYFDSFYPITYQKQEDRVLGVQLFKIKRLFVQNLDAPDDSYEYIREEMSEDVCREPCKKIIIHK